MTDNFEKQYQDIINKFGRLRDITADAGFRARLKKAVLPSFSDFPRRSFYYRLSFRFALASLILLLSGGALVFASEKAKPNDLLYPVRKMVEGVRTTIQRNSPAIKKNTLDQSVPTPGQENLEKGEGIGSSGSGQKEKGNIDMKEEIKNEANKTGEGKNKELENIEDIVKPPPSIEPSRVPDVGNSEQNIKEEEKNNQNTDIQMGQTENHNTGNNDNVNKNKNGNDKPEN